MKEKVEYYTLKPRLKQFFGRKITKSLTFDEKTDDKKIHQTLKDLVLTTKIRDTRTITMLINGEEKEMFKLGMAKRGCEDWSSILYPEKDSLQ